jgi:high affinity sulfate transporter 1
MRVDLAPPTLRGYKAAWLAPDIVAGLTLVAIAIPEQMATARLANMPAVTGLYAFIAGALVFFALGENRHMSVGADSTIAPVFAAGVATVAVAGSPTYVHLVGFVALITGVLVAASGLLRLGWIADFLPTPVVTGVMGGIAIEIAVRQFPSVLGTSGGGTTTFGRLSRLFDERDRINGWAVGIALAVLVIVVVTEQIDRRIPGALIGLVISAAVVGGFGLHSHGVNVVGALHAGLPSFGIPSVNTAHLGKLVGTCLTVAFLCVVQTGAVARSGDADPEPAAELNRDLIAVGASSVLAGLSGSFAVNVSPPRTAVVEAAGGRSQIAGLVAAAAVVAVLAVSGVLTDLPQATLGAILLYVAHRLFNAKELRRISRFDRVEFGLAVITIAIVGFVGIEQGVVTATVLALAQRTRLAARPKGVFLGREPGTDHWIPDDIGRPTEQVPGIVVYLLYAPLWYGNAAYVTARLRAAAKSSAGPVRGLILDADGVSDIDYTAAKQFEQFAAELTEMGVTLGVARASHLLHHGFKHSGLLDVIGADHFYPTVQDAVAALSG